MSETGPQSQPDDALVDLLIKQITEGLSPEEQRALDATGSTVVADYLVDLERAAAAVTLAGTTPIAPPMALQARLVQQAESHFATSLVGATVINFKRPAEVSVQAPLRRGGAFGWLAAAACLVLAVIGWMREPKPLPAPVAEVLVPAPIVAELPVTPPSPTLAEQRDALLASAASVKVTLGATKDPSAQGVTGDAVWDPASQSGFLRFTGLAANDPKVKQYQIWIFDGQRDKRYPVDGGVFDVPADASEVIIPFHATLSITLAKAFAVTVEKPGGVVVSGLGHVVALGTAG